MSEGSGSPQKLGDEAAATAEVTASNHEGPYDFKLENLRAHFEACLSEDGTLSVDKYIAGYEELYKFLNLLGTVFGWVASDVHAKLEILRGHRGGEAADKYVSIQTMLEYEVEADLIKRKAKDSTTGARNLLRLHRALEYINAFLDAIPALEMTEKCCGISQEAYKKTLIKFHPWIVQKAALMAMHMLPTKEGLIHKICEDAHNEEEYNAAASTLEAAVKAMKAVYDKTEEEYKKKDLLSLP